jgi:general secretion pathway protein C
MSSLVRPAFHAFTIAMLACACMMVAQTINTVLGVSLSPLPTLSVLPRQEPAPVATASATPLSADLLARYTGLPLTERWQTTSQVPDSTVPTQLGLKLLGTMMSPSPGMSLAAVYEDGSRRTRTVWVGSSVQGAEILSIERTRLLLSNGGRMEILDISSVPAAPGMAMPLPVAAPATGFGSTLRQTGPETYAIQRQDVDNTLANMNQVAMQARVVPSFINGVPRGFKLFALKPDSIFTRLGLKNGDILQRINGFTLDNPTSALEAYNHLKGSSRIELEIEREGQPVRKSFTVED